MLIWGSWTLILGVELAQNNNLPGSTILNNVFTFLPSVRPPSFEVSRTSTPLFMPACDLSYSKEIFHEDWSPMVWIGFLACGASVYVNMTPSGVGLIMLPNYWRSLRLS